MSAILNEQLPKQIFINELGYEFEDARVNEEARQIGISLTASLAADPVRHDILTSNVSQITGSSHHRLGIAHFSERLLAMDSVVAGSTFRLLSELDKAGLGDVEIAKASFFNASSKDSYPLKRQGAEDITTDIRLWERIFRQNMAVLHEFSDDEIQGLEGLSEPDLRSLSTGFNGLVATMRLCRDKSSIVGAAHQSHHLGWDHYVVEALAQDEPTLKRAEAKLMISNPDSLYFYA
jgi:hypothetical protein